MKLYKIHFMNPSIMNESNLVLFRLVGKLFLSKCLCSNLFQFMPVGRTPRTSTSQLTC
jgi:hypothetical protein